MFLKCHLDQTAVTWTRNLCVGETFLSLYSDTMMAGRGDLGEVVSGFLSTDGDIQMGYVGIGIQLIEEGIAEYLGGLTDRQGAQDRILLENVQEGWRLEHKISFLFVQFI